MKSLGFPNGIELTDDKSALLICEFNNRRIMKHYIDGDKRGQTDIFAYNLPGEPDKYVHSMSLLIIGLTNNLNAISSSIRRSSDPYRESYWVALAMGRNDKNPSFALDHLSGWPKTRKALLRALYTLGTVIEYAGKWTGFTTLTELGFKTKTGSLIYHTITHYGMAVELDGEGKIIQSLHSPDGRTTLLSEVREVIVGDRKVLYLGSFSNNYIGKMTLGLLAHLNRPLLTHEKKQYIEQQKQKTGKTTKPKAYVPYEPFDLQNPHFGPQKQKAKSQEPFDYDFPESMPSMKRPKPKNGSKKKKTKSSKTKKSTQTKSSVKQKLESESKLSTASKPVQEFEPKSKPESEQELKSQLILDLNPDSEPQTKSEINLETKPESKSESKPHLKSESESKPNPESNSEPKADIPSNFDLKRESEFKPMPFTQSKPEANQKSEL